MPFTVDSHVQPILLHHVATQFIIVVLQMIGQWWWLALHASDRARLVSMLLIHVQGKQCITDRAHWHADRATAFLPSRSNCFTRVIKQCDVENRNDLFVRIFADHSSRTHMSLLIIPFLPSLPSRIALLRDDVKRSDECDAVSTKGQRSVYFSQELWMSTKH